MKTPNKHPAAYALWLAERRAVLSSSDGRSVAVHVEAADGAGATGALGLVGPAVDPVTAAEPGVNPPLKQALKPALDQAPGQALDQALGQAPGEALGEALRSAMSAAGFKPGGKTAVGLPAGWVSTQSFRVPSSDPAAVRGAVRLRVARDYATGAGGEAPAITADYRFRAADDGSDVTLAALPNARRQFVETVCRAAGLSIQQIVPSALAAVWDDALPGALVQDPAGLAYALRDPVSQTIQLLTLAAGCPADAQRALSQCRFEQAAGQLPAEPLPLRVLDHQASTAAFQPLATALNASRTETLNEAPAITAWLKAASSEAMFDLRADRLSLPEKQGRPPWHRWAVIGAALLIFAVGYPAWTYWGRVSEANQLEQDTRLLASEASGVERMLAQIKQVDPWFEGRVSPMACLYEISRLAPSSNGRARIDVTGLRLAAGEMPGPGGMAGPTRGTLTGQAASRDTAIQLLSAMRSSPVFKDPSLRDTTPLADRSVPRGAAEASSGGEGVGPSGGGGGVRFEIVFEVVSGQLGKGGA